MVMLANHKTIHQIAGDLKLFLGANTDRFTVWLQKVISTPDMLVEKEEGTCSCVCLRVCSAVFPQKLTGKGGGGGGGGGEVKIVRN